MAYIKRYRTGDNPSVNQGVLKRAARFIIGQGSRLIKEISDGKGAYAYIMQCPRGQRYYLVAKGSKMYDAIISVQKAILLIARDEERPIIVAWYMDAVRDPVIRMFDPGKVLVYKIAENKRFDSVMVNFKWSLGEPLFHLVDLLWKWRIMHRIWLREEAMKEMKLI